MLDFLETAALSALLRIDLSRPVLLALLRSGASLETVWHSECPAGLTLEDRGKFLGRDRELFSAFLRTCEKHEIRALSHHSDHYPLLLKEIGSAPAFLFYRGDPELLSRLHPVAVVGTRRISDYGRQVLQDIIPTLVKTGVTIVSGLAHGIDGLAHEIALQHGGKCIAVLGNGLDIVYPSAHRNLARDILANAGVIVSELPPGMGPLPQFFPARNRIISGLSKATIVVEAKEQSGSLITAQFALEQNRDVYAVPGNIFSENQQGTNQLIAQGAYPLLSSQHLLQQLQLSSDRELPPAKVLSFDTAEEKSLYEALQEPRSLNELAEQRGGDISNISQLLSMMEIKGFVKVFGQRYVRS